MCNGNCVCGQEANEDKTASRGAAIPVVSAAEMSWLRQGLEEGKYRERERLVQLLQKEFNSSTTLDEIIELINDETTNNNTKEIQNEKDNS